MPLNAADIAGKSFLNEDETTVFFDTGAGTEADPSTGEFDYGSGEPTIPFEWYVESFQVRLLSALQQLAYSPRLTRWFFYTETSAHTAPNGTKGMKGMKGTPEQNTYMLNIPRSRIMAT
jgi:hypothetical protein